MKNSKQSDRYWKALLLTMLFCASVHMIILIIFALINNQLILLNLFNILDLELIIPGIDQGIVSAILAFAAGVMIYFCALRLLKSGLVSINFGRDIKDKD